MFGSSFGQASTSSAFGPASFGKPTFSSPGFGAANNTLFGQPNTQQPSTSLFGATQPQSTFGTGLFGAQPQATTSTGTGLFGSQPTSTNTSGGLFGSSSSGFGQNKPAFGGFGGNTSGGLFGQSNTMFGQTNQAQPGTSNLFGGTSTGFGGAATSGTTIKFTPVTGTDTMVKSGNSTTINTRHVCITCMKEYENKSLEELRYEDYKANRKGPQQGAQTTGSFFGTTAQPSLFGTSTSTAQQPTTSLFGASADNKSLFGQQTSTFGQTTNTFGANNSLFGKPNTGFGAPVSTQANTFSFNPSTFGQPQTTAIKPFGAAAPQTSNLFGANTSQAPAAFGAPQTSGFGSFGQSSLNFNQNKSTFNLGGNTTSTAFGFGTNTATNNTSLFGQKPAASTFGLPNNTGSTFGTSTSFGTQPAQASNLFNSFNKPNTGFQFNSNPAPNTSLGTNTFGGGSLFGNNSKPTGSLFGNTNNTSLFGNTNFGATTNTSNTFGQGLNTGFNLGGTSNTLVPQATPASNNLNTQQILNLASMPYYAAPTLYKGVVPTSDTTKLDEIILPAFQKNRINDKNITVSPNTSYKIKVKAVGNANASTKSLFDGLSNDTDDSEKYFNMIKSHASKRLMVLPKKSKSMTLQDKNVTREVDTTVTHTSTSPAVPSPIMQTPVSSKLTLKIAEMKENIFPSVQVTDLVVNKSPTNQNVSQNENTFNLKLTRKGYYLSPSLNELKQLKQQTSGPCIVEGFTIGHDEYGSVTYLEPIDITELNNLDFDKIVEFSHKIVEIYPDDENKPPVGTALNRPAKVTLHGVWPTDKSTKEVIKDVQKVKELNFENIVMNACRRMQERDQTQEVEFVSYQPSTGTWCFKVKHFSKYGLLESDEEGMPEPKKAKTSAASTVSSPQLKTPPLPLAREKAMTPSPKQKLRNDILVKEVNRSFASNDVTKQMDLSRSYIGNDMDMGRSYDVMLDMDAMDYIESSTEALARHIGTDPYKVQLMKQYFDDPFDNNVFPMGIGKEFYIENKAHYSGGRLFKAGSSFAQNNMGGMGTPLSVRALSPTSEIEMDKQSYFEEDELSLAPSNVKLEYYRTANEVIPVKYIGLSYYQGDEAKKNIFNIDYMKRLDRRFQATWVNHKRMFLTNINNHFQGDNDDEFSDQCNLFQLPPVSNDLLQLVDTSTPCLSEREASCLRDHLQVCLQNSNISVKQGCPYVVQNPGNNMIHEHSNLSNTADNKSYEAQVWNLCVALWGNLDAENHSHDINLKRKNNLTQWLESVMEDNLKSSDAPEEVIFDLVSQHKIQKAMTKSQESGNYNLALILSMLGCNDTMQGYIQEQLAQYITVKADTFIDKSMLKLMLLVSGQPLYDANHGVINVCESLNWKLAFGLHLWYLEPSFKSIADVVKKYEAAWNSEEAYCLHPTPHYSEYNTDFKDLCYHLLVLYSHKSHSLVELLNPATHSPNPLEFRLSWFVKQALQALGYSHIDSRITTKYHVSFASQLLSYDLWEYAIFVFMHIEDDDLRRHHIETILERQVELCATTSELTAKETLLVEKLNIPREWIYKCKGTLALYKNEYWDACEYYLKAKEYRKCHEVLFDKVVSMSVLNEEYDFIEDILCEIYASISHTDKKTWWKNGGEWLTIYFNIANQLNSSASVDFMEISPEVASLLQDLEAKYSNDQDGHHSYYYQIYMRLLLLLKNSGHTEFIPNMPLAPYLFMSIY